MGEPRAEKVAVVQEVRERLDAADASVVTEYRGLTVAELAELRKGLAGEAEYKVFKNTLVRRAVADSDYAALAELLSGPTAITFVRGDISATAKVLRDFSRNAPSLVVKGGMVEGRLISAADLAALADLPSREVLLAQLAGGLAAPLRQLATLMQALPTNFAYGLSALVDQRGGAPAAAEAGATEAAVPEAADVASDAAEHVDAAPGGADDAAEAPAGDAGPAAETTE